MKFVINSAELSSRLQTIGRVITTKNTLHILGCFIFEIRGNMLRLLASDGEILLSTSLTLVSSEVDGTFAINAKNIVDAIRNIPDQPITISVNETTFEMLVEYLNGKYTLMAEGADEYPTFVEVEADAATVDLPSEFVLRSITRAIPASADDDARPVMTGIYFDVMPKELTIVASDGHKLVSGTLAGDTTLLEEQRGFILPKKPALLLKTLLAKDNENVTIKFSTQNAVFTNSLYSLSCRLIEGRYPNYRGVIPASLPNVVAVDRAALLGALNRTLALTLDNAAVMKMQLSTNEVMLTSQNLDYATAAEEKMVCQYDGMPMTVGFKGSTLMELINNLECDTIEVKLIDPTRPCVIMASEEDEKEKSLALIMPMMLSY